MLATQTQETATVVATCRECGSAHQVDNVPLGYEFMFKRCVCEACDQKINWQAFESSSANDKPTKPKPPARTQEKWERICPPKYANVDRAGLPKPAQSIWHRVTNWTPAQVSGIGLVGPSRIGKSMLLHHLAKLMYFAKHDVYLSYGTDFMLAMQKHDERPQILDRMASAELLLVDDLHAPKWTDRVISDLLGVLDIRCRWERPLFCTMNGSESELAHRIGQQVGAEAAEALINRITELATIIRLEP